MQPADQRGRFDAWRAGLLYTLSISPSYLVFGTVCGVASKQAGLDLYQALLLPALVFGGSAQVAITALIIGGAPLLVVIASGVMINSRMAVYSALLSTWLSGATQSTRTKAACLIVDQTYVAAVDYRGRNPGSPYWLDYYFATGISLWIWWGLCNILGYVGGTFVPTSWELDFAVPLSFVAVLGPIVKRFPMAVAAVLGAVLSVIFYALPLKLGLLCAAVLGVAIIAFADFLFKWTPPSSGSPS